MTQHAKKPASHKKPHPSLGVVETAQEVQKKVIEMERDGIEGFTRAVDSCSRAAGELASIYSGNMTACVESGSKTIRVFQELGNEIMESSQRNISDAVELSREAAACRTPKDVTEWRSNVIRRMSDSYFEGMNKLSGLLFESCNEALEPLNERTAVASEQIRKAMAA